MRVLLIFTLLLLVSAASAATNCVQISNIIASGDCTTDGLTCDAVTGTQNAQDAIGTGTILGYATIFTADNSIAKCAVDIELYRVGTPTGTWVVNIYASDGGSQAKPTGSALAGPYTITLADITATDVAGAQSSPVAVAIDFTPTNSTAYFLAVEKTSGAPDADNNLVWVRYNNCATEDISKYTTSWLDESSYYALGFSFKE